MDKKSIALILIGIALRAILAIGFYGNYDQASFELVAEIGRNGGNVYAETSRYNYAPTWSIIITTLSYLPIPLHASIRLFLTILDLFIAFLIFKITNKTSLSILYILNPVSILLTGYHGQFENLALSPLLIAILLQQQRRSLFSLFLLCTLSLLIKHITIFFVVAIFFYYAENWRKGLLLSITSVSIFVISFIPYLPDGFENIVNQVFLNSSDRRIYGLQIFSFWSTPFFLTAMVVVLFLIRKKIILIQLLFISIFFLILTPGIGNQYFILPVIIGIFSINYGYIFFTLITTIFLLGSSDNLGLPIPSIWFTVWISLVAWAIYQTSANKATKVMSLDFSQ